MHARVRAADVFQHGIKDINLWVRDQVRDPTFTYMKSDFEEIL